MIVLATILILWGYFLVVRFVARQLGRRVREQGGRPWVWQAVLWVAAYMVVFWDFIPTIIVHNHYCAKDGGLVVNKTVTQWLSEHQNETQNIRPLAKLIQDLPWHSDKVDGRDLLVQRINERLELRSWHFRMPGLLTINRSISELVDTATNERLLSLSDYHRGTSIGLGGENAAKWWIYKEHCVSGQQYQQLTKLFYDNVRQALNIEGDAK